MKLVNETYVVSREALELALRALGVGRFDAATSLCDDAYDELCDELRKQQPIQEEDS